MSKIISIITFSFLLSFNMTAQELNCQVSVNSDQVQESDKRRFDNLQKSVYEFMNTRTWTNRKFKTDERIECSVYITFDKSTQGELYKGSIQIQSRRPVFNSAYHSPMLNLKDENFSFQWVEYDPLNFDINSYTSNLTSILAYYAYIIIGTDFDSYGLMGGTPFFNSAQTIVTNAAGSNYLGWKSMENDDNRYWFLENVLNSRYEDFRSFTYNYHRLGLDVMYEELNKGRVEALNSLKLLQNVFRIRPNLYIIKSLMDAKADEFIGLFGEAQPNEKEQAKNILISLDPSNASNYQKIIK